MGTTAKLLFPEALMTTRDRRRSFGERRPHMPLFASERNLLPRSIAEHRQATRKHRTGKQPIAECKMSPMPRILSRAQAAAYCSCSVPSFNDWIRRGIVPGPIPGTNRWDRKAIDAALDRASGLTVSIGDPFDEWKARRDARISQGRSLYQDAPG